LAEKFKNGELTTSMLLSAPYEEVFDALIKVRGLGKWSVEMFACFSLKRMDIFSTGDLGVQRGMAALIGKDIDKLKAGKGGKWKVRESKR
jgi:DNA-3-methyladenine glycosylase II